MKRLLLFIVVFSLVILFSADVSLAKTDLSITENDITFSKENAMEGEIIRMFARVLNTGDTDVYGHVVFLSNGKEISDPQPISVRTNNYDDVFIDYKISAGSHSITAKIISENPSDENLENNTALKKEYFVDSDTDKDGSGNQKDADDDNDGLSDDQEISSGTNPLLADTDGDHAKDGADAFPKDKTEWQDTDKDGLGDVKDLDGDNDGIFYFEEEFDYGTNPLSADTDNDGIKDQEEIISGTSPADADTDKDGTDDLKDEFPIDPSKTTASLMDALARLLNSEASIYYIFGIPGALLVLFLLFRKKRRR